MLKREHHHHPLLCVIALSLSAGCSLTETRDDGRLAARLDEVLTRLSADGAVVHARVIELPGGREIYERNSEKSCTPASNFKILTSAAGLDLLGAGFRAKTWLAMDGDDLWLIGTGDPGTGDPRLAKAAGRTPLTMLDDWADALQRRGIRTIKGDLIYDDSSLERDPRVHPSWPKSWLRFWYGAPTAGLNFNDNCVDITVEPTEPGKPARCEVMPPVDSIEIINECITGAKGSPSIIKRDGGNIYHLRGGCDKRTELASKPVEDPGAFFADALRKRFAAKGITIAGQTRRATAPLGGAIPPPTAKVVAVYETPLTDIVSRVNKNSQNLFAECLCKMTGREFEARLGRSLPGSWTSGAEALRAFLKKNHIDDSGLVPMDGSGLSPENRLTARMLTDVLAVMFRHPDARAFRASLAVAGVDGSLRDRMGELKGRVFGKTGYIGGVSSLCGYIHTHQRRWVAFAMIYNGIPEKLDDDRDVKPYTQLADEACGILADWPHVKTRPASRPASTTTAP